MSIRDLVKSLSGKLHLLTDDEAALLVKGIEEEERLEAQELAQGFLCLLCRGCGRGLYLGGITRLLLRHLKMW